MRVFLLCLFVTAMGAASAFAGECASSFRLVNSNDVGYSQQSDVKGKLGEEISPSECWKKCTADKHDKITRNKNSYDSIHYSCIYDGKTIKKVTQIFQ